MSDIAAPNAFEAIKPGDTIVIDTSSRGVYSRTRSYLEKVVERVTATRIVVGDRRWRRKDGREVSADYYSGNHIVIGQFAEELKREATLWLIMNKAERALDKRWKLTRESIEQMRAAADIAEAALREAGQW